jgi:cytochrome c oxidase subunit 2
MNATPGPPASLLALNRVWWMPPNGALHGLAIDRLMQWNLMVLCALFLLAHVLLIAVFFRSKKQTASHALPEKAHRSTWSTEILPLVALSLLYAWMALTAHRLWAKVGYQGPAPQALQVEVTGEQFQWYFRYPGADRSFGATHPELINAPAGNPLGLDPNDFHGGDDYVSSILVLPVGEEVDLRLRSIDVIHGFFIPGMRLKQNAVPGMEMHIHFTPAVIGDYSILCSQVCGLGHSRMQTHLRVVSVDEFQRWLATAAEKTRANHRGDGQ